MAIAASQLGLRVTVADCRKPPIDKTCGEGLLPSAVDAIDKLGISIASTSAIPFCGIRFSDQISSASARFPRGGAFGLRRTLLNERLIQRATDLGVSFLWGSRITGLEPRGVSLNGSLFPSRWIVGADGQNSTVRRLAGLRAVRLSSRFGFRQHFAVAPWSGFVEVHWGNRCQMIVTPTNPWEVCVALLCSDPRLRIEKALAQFPEITRRLRGARPVSAESGAVTGLSRARSVTKDNIALIGDASCTIDGVAGQGLSLALQQAIPLAKALASGDLTPYSYAHEKLTTMAVRMTRLMLLLDRSAWIRQKTLRLFEAKPQLFSKVLSVHAGQPDTENFTAAEMIGLSWKVLFA